MLIKYPKTLHFVSLSCRWWSFLLVLSFGGIAVAEDEIQGEGPFDWNIGGMVADENGTAIPNPIVKTIPKLEKSFQTTGTNSGRFRLRFRSAASYRPAFIVTDQTGTMSSFVAGFDHHRQRKLFRIVVRPNHKVTVKVEDQNGDPVPDARVGVIASHQPIAAATTDLQGFASLEVPADAKIDWIYARKSGKGFDYYENYDAFPTVDRLTSPDTVTLRLNGASDVRVVTVETSGKPVGNVRVLPWTIKLPKKLSYINLSGVSEFSSDETGVASFAWIPQNLVGGTTFLTHHEDYHCPQAVQFNSAVKQEGATTLKAELLRVATVSGRVTLPDGSPARRIHIQGEGRGNTNFYFRGHTITDANGEYELKIYPDQSTIVAVTEKVWSAKSHTHIKLTEGLQKKNVDFQLSSGTLIHGIATIGKSNAPTVGDTATLLEKADGTTLVRWSRTDQDGHYEFRVGPGEYQLVLPNQPYNKQVSISVTDQKEVVNNTHAARKERGMLTGLTVMENGSPLSDCQVLGESLGQRGHAGFKTRSNNDGEFSTERWNDDMVLYAFNAKKNLAGTTTISEDDVEVTIALVPAAAVSGRLVDKDGKPIANCRTQLLMSPPGRNNFGGFSMFLPTDEKGRYAFSGIAVGTSCSIHHYLNQQSVNGPSFEVESTAPIQLDDSKVE